MLQVIIPMNEYEHLIEYKEECLKRRETLRSIQLIIDEAISKGNMTDAIIKINNNI